MGPIEFLIAVAPAMLVVGGIIVVLCGLLYLAAYGAFALWMRHRFVSRGLYHQFAMGVLIGLSFTILPVWGWTQVPSENLGQVITPFVVMFLAGMIGWAMAVLAVRGARQV